MPATASAHARKHTNSAHAVRFHGKPQVGEARGRTLIFGAGDQIDVGLGVSPSEPTTNLQNILTNAGFGVDVSSTLPASLMQYQAIWFIDTSPLSGTEETELEAFVNAGRGLFLTGERACCTPLDDADGAVIDALVAAGGVQVGGPTDADDPTAPNAINTSVIDNLAFSPNVLTSWTPDEPGSISGVASENVLTSTGFGGQSAATGAAWDGSSFTSGRGRLAILMDINWLETEFWDQTTAAQMAINIERFLLSSTPVPSKNNPQWAGFAAKAHGVSDVNGAWTVPNVDCSNASTSSAVGIWVGIDGYGNSKLVKAGVGVTCAGPTASPCYYVFTEVLPGSENPSTSGCSGVSPGDDISVDVTNSPFGSSTFVATITDNNAPVGGSPVTLKAPTKRDRSAECVVQLPPKTVGTTSPQLHYKKLADFGSVSFTQCQATATQNAGNALDTEELSSGSDGAFTVAALIMGSRSKSKATIVQPSPPDPSWSVTWIGSV
jgi:hypothetical protein